MKQRNKDGGGLTDEREFFGWAVKAQLEIMFLCCTISAHFQSSFYLRLPVHARARNVKDKLKSGGSKGWNEKLQ
jgi:hypothetical protein